MKEGKSRQGKVPVRQTALGGGAIQEKQMRRRQRHREKDTMDRWDVNGGRDRERESARRRLQG